MGLFSSNKKSGTNTKSASGNTANTKSKQMKKSPLTDVPKTVQGSIPYLGVYENGIFQNDENTYSKVYKIPDMNFLIEDTERQKEIFGNFMELLSSFGPEVHVQQVIFNKTIKPAELESKVLMKTQNDKLNEYREEMNEMLIDKMAKASNNIIHEKYFVLSVEADDIVTAKATFERLDREISAGFERVTKTTTKPLTLIERLSLMYDIYNMDSNVPFYRRTKMKKDNIMESFNMRHIQKMGLTSKDVIGPSALTFERDYMIIGTTYARAMMVSNLPSFLRGDILTELSNMPFNMLTSVHYRALPQSKAITLLKNKLVDVNANVVTLQKKASRNGYSVDVISPEIKQASQEVESLMGDLTQDNQKLFYTTITAVIFAKTKEELDENTKLFQATAERFVCQAMILATQQEAGLTTALPLGRNKLKVERLLNSRAAAIFLPFGVKELWQDDGMYYGLNGVSKQMILYNRSSAINGNGCIFGVPGSGKSFSAKREIVNVLLHTDDDVFVIDPENEYAGLAKLFYGSSIRIAPGSDVHINPMDMGLDYSAEGDDPITMKADFIASICEAATGSRYPLTPIQKSVIDRCVKNVYREYIRTLRAEGKSEDAKIVPTLRDFYEEVKLQPEPEAHNLALALEKFVEGTQNSFAFRTNVNVNNRFTIYNIKDIGTGMKSIGLQVCLDNIWNKMIANYKKGKRTWLYCDEFHLLTQTEISAKYTQQIWRRARKWNGIPTGITQQVEDMMKTEEGRAIIGNSEFVMMLSMNAYGRAQMQQMYNLTDAEMEYITSSGSGHGLIYNGKDIISFVDEFPKDTKLYNAMTTKAGEGEVRE